jgi:hypothetical protein
MLRRSIDYTSVPEPDEAVSVVPRELLVVCHKDNSPAIGPPHFIEQFDQFNGAAAIKVSGGFIGKEYIRCICHGSRNRYPLLLAA